MLVETILKKNLTNERKNIDVDDKKSIIKYEKNHNSPHQ